MKTESPGRHPAHVTKASLLRWLRRHKPQRPKTHKLKCEVLSCLSPLDESPATFGHHHRRGVCEKHNPPRITVFQKGTLTTLQRFLNRTTLLVPAGNSTRLWIPAQMTGVRARSAAEMKQSG